MSPLGWISGLLGALSRMIGPLMGWMAGRSQASHRATKKDIRRANEIEDKADEVKKRIADDDRTPDERLRDLGRLRD